MFFLEQKKFPVEMIENDQDVENDMPNTKERDVHVFSYINIYIF